MNFMNAISALTAAAGKVMPLALNYNAVDENAILNTVVNWVCAVILVIGIIYGGWELAQGFMDDAPSKKKHGITVLIVGISIAAVIYSIMSLILGG